MWRKALAVAVLTMAVGASPAAAEQVSDPFTDLGGGSPSCRLDVGTVGRDNCNLTGSVAHRYPLSSYELDVHVPFSVTKLGNAFLGALQNVAALMWMALVYLLKGVLLLLEWGFSLDLLSEAMGGVRRTLMTLHQRVIGQPWFLAALSVTALWGIWRGLVQRQAAATISGLLATVGLMLCALVILARPAETVGHASRLANDASLGLLSAATGESLSRPSRSLANSSQGIFESMVRDPWCALQFGSVEYCDAPARVPQMDGRTVAEQWLAHPAGSEQRDRLFDLMKEEQIFSEALRVEPEPERIRIQEADGTFSRFAILGLIAIGMTGAAALLAYLGIRLLLASILALLLLLLTPAMLLAPAFGETGRATFVAWFKRLAGAIAAKLIYALFLAVVLAAAATLRRLDIGWVGTWLLQIAFWWGVLLKRHELIGFASAGQASQPKTGFVSSLAHGYYAMQLGRSLRAASHRVMARPGRAAHALADRSREVRAARATTASADAGSEFDAQAKEVLVGEQERARDALARRRQTERELKVVDRRLTAFDENHAGARAVGRPAPLPTADQAALLRQRRSLLEQLSANDMRGADQVVAHADRNVAQFGDSVSTRDLAAYRRRRRQDLAADLPLDHERHLRAAGIEPQRLADASADERQAILERVERHVSHERELLARIPDEDPQGSRRELRIDPGAARRKRASGPARFTRTPPRAKR